jgi:hypothetical protein
MTGPDVKICFLTLFLKCAVFHTYGAFCKETLDLPYELGISLGLFPKICLVSREKCKEDLKPKSSPPGNEKEENVSKFCLCKEKGKEEIRAL